MRIVSAILGVVVALAVAAALCEPIYDIIWPGATDKREGGVGFFFVFMLAPISIILGGIIGAMLYGRFFKKG
jgi:hypothetical protein